jgi:hypothetical protein
MKPNHNHVIVQQIIPATIDAYAMFAFWVHGEGIETVRARAERIPAWALVADCKKDFNDDAIRCEADLYSQRTEPLINGDYNCYLPVTDSQAELMNDVFLGIRWGEGDDREWLESARDTFERAQRHEAAKKKKQEKETNNGK